MYVRIAPQNDYDEAKSDYEEVKKKIDGNHPDTISFKPGHVLRRAIKIPAEGFGTLKKEGRDDVLCYYFVVQYSDDYSDYEGGIIECFDGYSIELAEEKGKQSDYNHTLKGNYYPFFYENYYFNFTSDKNIKAKLLNYHCAMIVSLRILQTFSPNILMGSKDNFLASQRFSCFGKTNNSFFFS